MLIRNLLLCTPLLFACATTNAPGGDTTSAAQLAAEPELEIVYLQFASAPEMAESIGSLLDADLRAAGDYQSCCSFGASSFEGAKVMADARTNSLLLLACDEDLAQLKTLIAALDVAPPGFMECGASALAVSEGCCDDKAKATEAEVQVVRLEFASAVEVAETIEELLEVGRHVRRRSSSADSGTKIVADPRTNSLLISAQEEELARIKELIAALDVEVPSAPKSE